MALPLIMAGAGGVAKLLGGIFGGGTQSALPDWLLQELQKNATQDYSGFVPDQTAFTNLTNQNIKNVLSGLPVAQDQFNAGAASRGMFSSGEAMTHLYSDVYAPIQRNAQTAALQGQTEYAQLKQSGLVSAAQARMQALQLAVQGALAQKPTSGARFWNAVGDVGNTAMDFGTQQLGADMGNQRDYAELLKLLPLLKQMMAGGGGSPSQGYEFPFPAIG